MGDESADHAAIKHLDLCDREHHTDPAMDCTSSTVTTRGLVTHRDARYAYYEPQRMTSVTLDKGGCAELAARFTDLGEHLPA